MKINRLYVILGVLLVSCGINRNAQNEDSIWRDEGIRDKDSKYNVAQRCEKIRGTIEYKSILHKGFLEPNVFNGMIVMNTLEITEDSAYYRDIYGNIKDQGRCECQNGILSIYWEILFKRTIEYEVYFNSRKSVELRYFDYFKDTDYYFTADSSYLKGEPNNPTKISGELISKSKR